MTDRRSDATPRPRYLDEAHLIDTDVILRRIDRGSDNYPYAVRALHRLIERKCPLFIAPQTLYETWAVCTRPSSDNGIGMSIDETTGTC